MPSARDPAPPRGAHAAIAWVQWPLFGYGALCAAGMAHLWRLWITGENPEALIPVMVCAMLGWPAWLGLPLLVLRRGRRLRPIVRGLLLAPPLAAAVLYGAFRYWA